MGRIVFAHPDDQVRDDFGRVLVEAAPGWEASFAASGPETLGLLDGSACQVIFAASTLEDTAGGRLLDEVRRRAPGVVRIVVADGSDEQAVLKSVKSAHQCLAVPFDGERLALVLSRASTLGNLLKNERLASLLTRIDVLPSLPSLYVRLMDEINSEDSSMDRIGQIITEDIGMTTTVLKVVNSAFFGFPQRISTVAQAVTLLGLDLISGLVLSHQIFTTFDFSRVAAFSFEGLWRHSMVTGGFSRKIAQQASSDRSGVDQAFVAGLLHDVGKLVLCSTLPDKYNRILEGLGRNDRELWLGELEELGATHAEAGAFLVGLWGLDEAVVQALAFHHQPSDCPEGEFSALSAVHVANVLEHELCVINPDYFRPQLDAAYLARAGLEGKVARWRELYNQAVESRLHGDVE